jgi:hypothetical protein
MDCSIFNTNIDSHLIFNLTHRINSLWEHVSQPFLVIGTAVEPQQDPHALLNAGALPWHIFKGDWCEI